MNQPDQSDNREWVRSAVDRFQGPLCRYAARLLGDVERARDVVQETFQRLCLQRPADLDGRLAPWLFTVCRNRAMDVRRKERRMTTISDVRTAQRSSGQPSPSESAEHAESAGRALRFLADLPERQQEVVRLKFQEGLSYRQIGKVIGASVSNVGFIMHEALSTLRERMGAGEGE